MSEDAATVGSKAGKCLLHNWVEERMVAGLDTEETRTQILRHGHKGILTLDQESKMETVTTIRAAFPTPKGPGVRERGIRAELLEKHISQMISEEFQAAQEPPTPKTDFCSTTQRDFCVTGFIPHTPETTQVHDYKSDQAITFWSENRHRIHGVTPVRTLTAPFRKSALFSTPIRERLDEMDLPPDN